MLLLASQKGAVQAIIAAVSVPSSLHVFTIAVFRVIARGSPQNPALLGMGATGAVETVGLTAIAGLRVPPEDIGGTVFRLSSAVLWQIALVFSFSTGTTRHFGTTGGQITAFAGGTGGICVQHAGLGIATGILAMFRQSAVALLPRFQETIATGGRFKQLFRLIPQAVVHAAREGYR